MQLKEEASFHNCEWEFNPPHASNFGGLWERAIGLVRRIVEVCLLPLAKRPPSFDELQTFFLETASIINNTSMHTISSDPNDDLPLTPAQLITLKDAPDPPPLEHFSDADLLAYSSRRWKRVKSLSDSFWRRWRTEYLQTLQRRQKWSQLRPDLQKGDIVLMKTKGSKRNHWPLARVHSVKISSDGHIRSATLSLSPGGSKAGLKLLERPVSEMVLLLRNGGAAGSE